MNPGPKSCLWYYVFIVWSQFYLQQTEVPCVWNELSGIFILSCHYDQHLWSCSFPMIIPAWGLGLGGEDKGWYHLGKKARKGEHGENSRKQKMPKACKESPGKASKDSVMLRDLPALQAPFPCCLNLLLAKYPLSAICAIAWWPGSNLCAQFFQLYNSEGDTWMPFFPVLSFHYWMA